MDVVIYLNPACDISRKVLELIRAAGVEPHVIDYLKATPDKDALKVLAERLEVPPRAMLWKDSPSHAELGLDDANLSDDAILAAMETHPTLIAGPIVVTPKGARICRPPERVHDLLPSDPDETIPGADEEPMAEIKGIRR